LTVALSTKNQRRSDVAFLTSLKLPKINVDFLTVATTGTGRTINQKWTSYRRIPFEGKTNIITIVPALIVFGVPAVSHFSAKTKWASKGK